MESIAKKKVLLGMSGGTDSSVAALILQGEGYEVSGVTFRFYDTPESDAATHQAGVLARELGIEHQVFEARALFKKEIIDYFIAEYMQGRTPFPCVKCNNRLKWRLLAQIADERGIPLLATGHYVRLTEEQGVRYITVGADADKDQSFFLWGITQPILQRAVFPLGGLTKMDVRRYAADKGFTAVATRKDSMGVCFCPNDYRPFLRAVVGDAALQRGDFVDIAGNKIGEHEGYPFYTVGQRRGLGLNPHRPLFVKEIDVVSHRITLAHLEDTYCSTIYLSQFVCQRERDFAEMPVICKIRYRKQATLCRVKLSDHATAQVFLSVPLDAIAKGQSAVFYQGERVLGGGIIERAE